MGPLAEIAHQLGYKVSGSDLKNSENLNKMRKWQPAPTINIGQTAERIAAFHAEQPIDWYVYSSALAWTRLPNPELTWIKKQAIKHSKRDEFLNYLIKERKLELLAVTGSHGKTTTTAMIIWLLDQLGEKISYSLGGKIANMPVAKLDPQSRWFIYEADEFDYNFLSFRPKLSLITGIYHDHPEVFPTEKDYIDAFLQFIDQSEQVIIGHHDFQALYKKNGDKNQEDKIEVIQTKPPRQELTLVGEVNRQNATLALAAAKLLKPDMNEKELIAKLNQFPGSWRRFEKIADNLYTDYAHNPAKIAGCLQIAKELKRPIVVVYEPHSNQRQHLVKDQYKNLFKDVRKVYWLPSFLTREDLNLKILTPQDLIDTLANSEIAQVAEMNQDLIDAIKDALNSGAVVVAMSASSLDIWLRENLADKQYLKF